MSPIIDPAFFYWLNVLNGLKIFCGILGGLCGIAAIVVAIFAYVEDFTDEGPKIAFISLLAIAFVFSIACIFMPNKETMIEMQAAKLLTTDNITAGVEAVKDVINYIVNAIAEAG